MLYFVTLIYIAGCPYELLSYIFSSNLFYFLQYPINHRPAYNDL